MAVARRKAKKVKGPVKLTEAQFADELAGDLDIEVRDARVIIKTLKGTIERLVTTGHQVNLSGLVSIKPVYVSEKPKGEMVRNPSTGEYQKRAQAVPASFKVKASASPALKKSFPTTRTNVGKALAEQLQQ